MKNVFLSLSLSVILLSCTNGKNKNEDSVSEDTWDISVFDLMTDMKAGWNLGNTFDAALDGQSETNWGAPKTTHQMIKKLKEKGFNLVRLPISYSGTCDDQLQISNELLSRYKEVVDYCISEGMYVIINSHHDNNPNDDNNKFYDMGTKYRAQSRVYLSTIWKQVAECFKDYDHHVIFEGLNEPRPEKGETINGNTANPFYYEEWNPACRNIIINLNDANQVFVDAVRETGGNNSKRFLLVPSIAANIQYALADDFKLPNDNSEYDNRILLSVHYYAPNGMSLTGEQSEFTEEDKYEITNTMECLANKFTKKGVGVILGEWGTSNLENTEQRVAQATHYVKEASRNGIVCAWWDNMGEEKGGENFCIFQRERLTWKYPSIANTLINYANIKQVD